MNQICSTESHPALNIELACTRCESARHRLAQTIAAQWQQQGGAVAVFFHSEGVDVASADHPDHLGWRALAESSKVTLLLCSAAVERRELTVGANSPFIIATLTQWMDRLAGGGKHLVLNRYVSS